MKSSNRVVVAVLVVVALAIGFWVLALGPKRNEADELAGQVEQQRLALAEAQSKASEAAAARRHFPADYRRLVTLGQAAPAGDETSSLLVELNHIAERTKVEFDSIQLSNSGGEAAPAPEATPTVPAPTAEPASGVPASSTVPPTEAAASVMPLGASVGPAGLAVMPYTLTFNGDFFQIANFIKEVDSLVHTGPGKVSVDGRLVTIDGFALTGAAVEGFPHLSATFVVTTYLTPPGQGLTAGATPSAPASVTTVAGASEVATESAATASSSESAQEVAAR
ncbi:MAG TPA: hypothetical protein VG816_12250 [Solirubrobacterales bacterium]|nr:hypothetical protein [Solirubrobacterales bacterium]